MEKSFINFLKKVLEKCNVKKITIYAKGTKTREMIQARYEGCEDGIFMFKIRDCESKYIISEKEIDDVIPITGDAIRVNKKDHYDVIYPDVIQILIILICDVNVEIALY